MGLMKNMLLAGAAGMIGGIHHGIRAQQSWGQRDMYSERNALGLHHFQPIRDLNIPGVGMLAADIQRWDAMGRNYIGGEIRTGMGEAAAIMAGGLALAAERRNRARPVPPEPEEYAFFDPAEPQEIFVPR